MGHGQPLRGHFLRRQIITHSRVVPQSREKGEEVTHSDDHRQSVLFQEMLPSWTKLLGDTAEHPREGLVCHKGHERVMQKKNPNNTISFTPPGNIF